MKKRSSLLAVAILSMFLAACGEKPAPAPAAAPAAPAPAPAPAAPAKPGAEAAKSDFLNIPSFLRRQQSE